MMLDIKQELFDVHKSLFYDDKTLMHIFYQAGNSTKEQFFVYDFTIIRRIEKKTLFNHIDVTIYHNPVFSGNISISHQDFGKTRIILNADWKVHSPELLQEWKSKWLDAKLRGEDINLEILDKMRPVLLPYL